MEGAGGVCAGWFLPRWGQQRAASGCLGGNSQRSMKIPRFVRPPPLPQSHGGQWGGPQRESSGWREQLTSGVLMGNRAWHHWSSRLGWVDQRGGGGASERGPPSGTWRGRQGLGPKAAFQQEEGHRLRRASVRAAGQCLSCSHQAGPINTPSWLCSDEVQLTWV